MTPEDRTSPGTGMPELRSAPGPAMAGIRDRLRAFKTSLDLVIRSYPTPIAGCDEQFNHLLEHRDRVLLHLRRLDDLSHEGALHDDVIREIADFMDSSAFVKTSARIADPPGH